MAPDVDANRVAAAKKREARTEFMRSFVIAAVRSGRCYETRIGAAIGETVIRGEVWTRTTVDDARAAWDAIEAEASK